MKRMMIQVIIKKIREKDLSAISRLCLIVLIIGLSYLCFLYFKRWNEIPNQTIKADLTALGYISVKSYCNFAIKINAGSLSNYQSIADTSNRISVYNSPFYTEEHNLDASFLDRFKEVSLKYRNTLAKMYTFYVLDYYCHTTIPVATNTSKSRTQHNHNTFSYIDAPKWMHDSIGSSFSGSGFLAFPNFTNEEGMMVGDGTGDLSFNVNVMNGKPQFGSPWDVTQANYHLEFKCNNIQCDTISIEFYGATLFSNMYPAPDKTTMSGIEFTTREKVEEILNNGLRFHTDFTELKGLAAQRSFILAAIISLLIALFCECLFKSWRKKDKHFIPTPINNN